MSNPVRLWLPPEIDASIRRHAEAEYPHEACGALLGHGDGGGSAWRVEAVAEAPNAHEDDHRRRYLVPPEFQVRVEHEARAAGREVLGYYHSHPDHPAQPSEYDRSHAWFGYVYVICSVRRGRSEELAAFVLEAEGGAFAPIAVAAGAGPEG
jgi:proteasome lid subunit RPN8/RPN11